MPITTIKEVHEACNMLANLMVEKGVKSPSASITFRSGDQSHIHIRADYRTKPFSGKDYCLFTDGSFGDQIKAATAYINALMSPEDAVSNEYLRRVSNAIDYATENAIDEKMVSPLRGVSKAMTENLISKQEDAA